MQAELCRLSKGNLILIVNDLVRKLGKEGEIFLVERVEQLKTCWAFELPQQYFCVILTEWLSLTDVAHLDSALCSAKLRLRYLSCFTKGYVVFPNYPSCQTQAQDNLLSWLIARQVKLRSVDLFNFSARYNVVDPFISATGRSLHIVNLNGALINSAILTSVLDHCQNLKELRMCQSVFQVQANTMESILLRFQSLRLIDLSGSTCHVDGTGSDTELADGRMWANTEDIDIVTTQLEDFFVDGHLRLGDRTMLNIYSTCRRLRKISVNCCWLLTPSSFQQLPVQCPNLIELCANSTQLDDATLLAIASHCRSFAKLSANRCSNVTDTGVLAVLDNCPVLCSLELAHNHNITDQVLLHIYPHCPLMQVLNVSGCSSLTVSAVMTPIKLCPLLQTFRMLDFPPDFDIAVRTELYNGKYWLGNWKDRKLTIMQTSTV